MTERDFRSVVTELRLGKVFPATSEFSIRDDPYDDNEGMKVTLHNNSYESFHVRIKELSGCCGVLEVIRPTGSNTKVFDAGMRVVLGVLGMYTKVSGRLYSPRIGNQLLATTSTESCVYFAPWLRKAKWDKFKGATNPRTGHIVNVWRYTL